MEKKKNILTGSIVAGALLAVTGFNANAANLFSYSNLGTGEAVRTNLLNRENSSKMFELSCGEKKAASDSSMSNKMKDGKCGEGKCGEGKCGDKMKKAKDGKCGEGKCGDKMKKGDLKKYMKMGKDGKCGEGKCGADKKKTAPKKKG